MQVSQAASAAGDKTREQLGIDASTAGKLFGATVRAHFMSRLEVAAQRPSHRLLCLWWGRLPCLGVHLLWRDCSGNV